MVAACAAVTALRTIVARRVDPLEAAVVSVTELTTDGARNVLPGEARISGDVRSFSPAVSEAVEAEMRRIAESVAMAHGCRHGGLHPLVRAPGQPCRAGEGGDRGGGDGVRAGRWFAAVARGRLAPGRA